MGTPLGAKSIPYTYMDPLGFAPIRHFRPVPLGLGQEWWHEAEP